MKFEKINLIFLYSYLLIPFFFLISDIKNRGQYSFFILVSLTMFSLFFISYIKKLINKRTMIKFNYDIQLIFILIFFYGINFDLNHISFSVYLGALLFVILFYKILGLSFYLGKYLWRKVLVIIISTYFLLSLALTKTHMAYMMVGGDIRYSGMLLSSTTFGIVSIMLYIFFLKNSRSIILKFSLYFILLYLVYLSQSRLNLLLVLLMPIFFLKKNVVFFTKNTKQYFLIAILFIILFYPIYEYVKIYYEINSGRNNADASDNTRIFYSLKIISEIKINEIYFWFGHGANSSLSLIGFNNIKPHNDFLRLLYDYGIIFSISYLIFLYRLFYINIYMAFMIIVYMFSFYHNMVFDLYTLILIMMFSTTYNTKDRYVC